MNAGRVAATLLIIACAGYGTWHFRYAPTAFDPAVWRDGETAAFNDRAPRLRMADGLLRSGVLLGKTRPEVLALLGPPTDTGYFRDYDLVYWLGAERSIFPIDSEWLVLKLGPSGRVELARITSD